MILFFLYFTNPIKSSCLNLYFSLKQDVAVIELSGAFFFLIDLYFSSGRMHAVFWPVCLLPLQPSRGGSAHEEPAAWGTGPAQPTTCW